MANEREYSVYINGVKVPVAKDVYVAYYKAARRIRYYEHDIKVGRIRKKDGREEYLPSKEDSYDRLDEVGFAPCTGIDDVVEEVWKRIQRQCLYAALDKLAPGEFEILFEIFWNEKSERALSGETGVPQKTINDRKRRILNRLKKMLDEP